jgi:cyclic pyranopterin phosphate synthase
MNTKTKELKDNFGRTHNYLRISLTDKCNLNCIYCNPARSGIKSMPRNEILSFDEIMRLINIFVDKFGINKLRFTGGEPFARRGIMDFFAQLAPAIKERRIYAGITTNGTLLKDKLLSLKEYQINNINISLDSLNQNTFKRMTGSSELSNIISAIDDAIKLGFDNLKINVVVIRGINDNELLDFVRLAVDKNINVRFIEFMPFADNQWNENSFIGYQEMMTRIASGFKLELNEENEKAVSKDYDISGKSGKVSFISSVSDHFCGNCNRLRITANGNLKLCLFSSLNEGLDLKDLLRFGGVTDDDIATAIELKTSMKKYKHPDPDELIQLNHNNMISIGG